MKHRTERTWRWAAYLLAALLLAGTASLYLQPEFLVALANQLWACF